MKNKKNLRILVIDVGGSHVKVGLKGHKKHIKFKSGPKMTARKMVASLQKNIPGWQYDAVTIGYPGVVLHGHIVCEPYNLGHGWVKFNFKKAFHRPVKIINDAAMQALGSYEGGNMLFLGLGTGLGSAMIVNGTMEPMELAHLPYKNGRTYEDYIGNAGLKRVGQKKWRSYVYDVVKKLKAALEADYVVLGGGNARLLKSLPRNVRLGNNKYSIRGGYRLWEKSN